VTFSSFTIHFNLHSLLLCFAVYLADTDNKNNTASFYALNTYHCLEIKHSLSAHKIILLVHFLFYSSAEASMFVHSAF